MKVTGWTSVMTVVLMALVLVLRPSITGAEAGNIQGWETHPTSNDDRVFNGRPANRPSAGALQKCTSPPCRRPRITQRFFGYPKYQRGPPRPLLKHGSDGHLPAPPSRG
ncbi:uncharacterized protein LOC126999781 [Eriocheir sinensis]|uniref:uncharacterized protein LOC126999781 n=1 Tax=Eriocheir sinensis TaxID=95602 RepID=UPI0021CA269F|nr:uncharacterized protein LOC126999781 [Eriocheir sinensis]XP_050718650.1 uncharacterized protein LOC126999781 [Eriocheir sinensis]